MKTGKTLQELSAEIIRQKESKRDFVAPAKLMRMSTRGMHEPRITVDRLNNPEWRPVTDYAHWQLAAWLQIPKPYYERMLKNEPQLLSVNVNQWLNRSDEKRMVRTLDNNVRAILSDRYRPLDNYDLAENVLPALEKSGAVIESCEITERRMYIKAVRMESEGMEVVPGDVVKSGLVISNSEIGAGSLRVEPMVYRLICKNGAIAGTTLRKYHSGKRASEIGDYMRDDTIRATDRAFWMQVRDMVRSAMNDLYLREWVTNAQKALGDVIEAPAATVELVAKSISLNDTESDGVLHYLSKGGDLSRYGLANAITRYAQDVEDYDRSTELERLGCGVIELPKNDWARLVA